jgi:hypothetical protein
MMKESSQKFGEMDSEAGRSDYIEIKNLKNNYHTK